MVLHMSPNNVKTGRLLTLVVGLKKTDPNFAIVNGAITTESQVEETAHRQEKHDDGRKQDQRRIHDLGAHSDCVSMRLLLFAFCSSLSF